MKNSEKKPKIWSPDVYIISALRRIWRWSPERRKSLSRSFVETGWICASCSNVYQKDEIAIDHIRPVVDPVKGWEGWDIYIKRLFCKAEELQVLCKPCHKTKSNIENAERRKRKAA